MSLSPGGDPADAVSFRQVGKQVAGNVMRGALTGQRNGQRNFSSIPSKFETTLFTGHKEQNGFGMRAHRFVEHENDLPGPGSYAADECLTRDDKVYSKKGLGVGFVSKTKRTAAIGGPSLAPGPGQYEQRHETLERNLKDRARQSASNASSAFKTPTQRSVVVASEPAPGPGAYSARGQFEEQTARAKAQSCASSMPRSVSTKPQATQLTAAQIQAKRMITLSSNASTPAPGQYEPKQPEVHHHDSLLPSAAFRSTVPVAASWQSKPSRVTKEQALGVVNGGGASQPGPGSYDATVSAFTESKRRMPQFFDSNIDRFGKSLNAASETLPGPGAYHREEHHEKAPISSSAFMSNTSRTSLGGNVGVPGPAFYKPNESTQRKSYHLNAVQRWMPAV
uniref:Uncharacterized protein n=1 Tax=Chrysotila carterae TaxID=13221 RepID=A0A7S4EU81_CHRCT|mmetsp:Transcript_24382/g.53214  ORF Transcript_24382/g.53214 Transcript_24382/m.53214 type:complete len:394 (+) Transcript_24382:293-1474(+)